MPQLTMPVIAITAFHQDSVLTNQQKANLSPDDLQTITEPLSDSTKRNAARLAEALLMAT